MSDEFIDAADDWELEFQRQEEEEQEKLRAQEQLRAQKEEKVKNRRLANETVESSSTAETQELTDEGKKLLERVQQEQQSALDAAQTLGTTVENFSNAKIETIDDARKLGEKIAKHFAKFDDELLGTQSSTPVFEYVLQTFKDSKNLRDLEAVLNVAKTAAKSSAKGASDKKKGDKSAQEKTIVQRGALDLDTTDRGGAAEADDFI